MGAADSSAGEPSPVAGTTTTSLPVDPEPGETQPIDHTLDLVGDTDTDSDSAAATPPDAAPPTPLPSIDGVPDAAIPGIITPSRDLADPGFSATTDAFFRLARANPATSLTVVRNGEIVWSAASGSTIDGQPTLSDSPMVVASVSKFVVAVGVTRLESLGLLRTDDPVPWSDMGLSPGTEWNDVTVRELLDHTGGLRKLRTSWFTGQGSCRDYIPYLLTSAPTGDRGRWVYSNGNFCLLGLLLESQTGLPLDQALQQLVFDPIGADGVHLTDAGLAPTDVAHAPGVDRLSRLGGAGTLVMSTDDVAVLAGTLAPGDRWLLRPPGMFTDQYGYGHTGTIEGAKACVWLLDGGSTTVAATVAGDSPSTGGSVCDIIVPAVATDLGMNAGRPDRTP